jgi:uncharacterized membrane protein YvbJ|tara:strand:+ start:1918 stop:2292 length:375 start_codon:yes stop_codon:yes gene_type:complete
VPYCNNCGNNVVEETDICSNCGQIWNPIAAETKAAEAKAKEVKASKAKEKAAKAKAKAAPKKPLSRPRNLLIIGFIFITLCFFLVGSDQSVSGVGVLFFLVGIIILIIAPIKWIRNRLKERKKS